MCPFIISPPFDVARVLLFHQIVGWTKELLDQGKAAADCTGRLAVPTELKVLGVLRVLGRATCFDGITELSGIAESTMCTFFHRFTKWFREDIYPCFVYAPKTLDDLAEVQTPYALLGLPGCIGSMDVVHIAWCMCPSYLMNLAKGKEGIPTIAYNVICDHAGRALAVLAGAYGAFNDKTIVRNDDVVHAIRTDPFFTQMAYEVRTGGGNDGGGVEMEKGAYLIIDGGYHKWSATQAAGKANTDPTYAAWRKRMESVRKDIECFFGRLKGRFRMLKTPVTFHHKHQIDNTFFTCVALQNIIHDWDKELNLLTAWEVDADWEGAEGQFADEAGAAEESRLWCRPKLKRTKKRRSRFVPSATEDFSSCGVLSSPITKWDMASSLQRPPPSGEGASYVAKQAKLVKHFAIARASGDVAWLRS